MEVPRHWRLKTQRYRLVGSVCPTCGQVFFPPRPVCPECTTQPAQVSGNKLSALLVSKPTVDSVSSKG